MDFALDEQQSMLKATLERFVGERCAPEQRRAARAMPGGFDPANTRLLAELGIFALFQPESAGGLSGRMADIMIVMETLGHGLAIEPVLMSHGLAARLLALHGSSEQRDRWLSSIMDGAGQIGIGFLSRPSHQVVRVDANGALRGHQTLILDAPVASAFLIAGLDQGERFGLFLVPAGAPGLTLTPYRIVDGSSAVDLRLDDVRTAAADRIDCSPSAFARALDSTAIASAAEMLGIMDRLLGDTLDYAKTRMQFGQPIGHFQAIQHRLARAYVAVEQARSIILKAALTFDRAEGECGDLAKRCYRFVSDLALRVAQSSVQVYGGIGVTDELAIAQGHNRILVLRQMFGLVGEVPDLTALWSGAA